MDELGKWGKEHVNDSWNLAKPMVDRLVSELREDKMQSFLTGLSTGWGRREIKALSREMPPRPQIRVVVVRHGMGHHNDLGGGLSMFNRDATLNEVGRMQSEAAGAVLAATGQLARLDLVVVSPFSRTLETAALLLSAAVDRGHTIPTVVHPLAAEHTLLRSAMQQGDRGSTAAELRLAFPAAEYPQFDFSTIDEYCAERGITDGKWWHHVQDAEDQLVIPHETMASFERRAGEFRRWLGRQGAQQAVRNVLVVSHGGLLTAAFGTPEYQNVEFRAFDMLPHSGEYVRVSPEFTDMPQILRSEVRLVSSGEQATFYIVRFGEHGPELPKRFSDFEALKRRLKLAGKERFAALFPGKVDLTGLHAISGGVSREQVLMKSCICALIFRMVF